VYAHFQYGVATGGMQFAELDFVARYFSSVIEYFIFVLPEREDVGVDQLCASSQKDSRDTYLQS